MRPEDPDSRCLVFRVVQRTPKEDDIGRVVARTFIREGIVAREAKGSRKMGGGPSQER